MPTPARGTAEAAGYDACSALLLALRDGAQRHGHNGQRDGEDKAGHQAAPGPRDVPYRHNLSDDLRQDAVAADAQPPVLESRDESLKTTGNRRFYAGS